MVVVPCFSIKNLCTESVHLLMIRCIYVVRLGVTAAKYLDAEKEDVVNLLFQLVGVMVSVVYRNLPRIAEKWNDSKASSCTRKS